MATKLSERRSGLDALLRSIVKQRCGSENVYYQPPANLRMKYPCICYKLEKIRSPKADDPRIPPDLPLFCYRDRHKTGQRNDGGHGFACKGFS